MEESRQGGWGAEVNVRYKCLRARSQAFGVRRARPKQDTGEQPEESCYMMLASSKGSHEIVSQLLQFGGVAGYPITEILNDPAHAALRPPLGFLKKTRAISHENAEIVRAGRGNG
jgi:hypothetical protein